MCRICKLGPKKRKELETEFINGANRHQLAKKYNLSYDTVANHLEKHLPQKLVSEAKEQSTFDSTQLLKNIHEIATGLKEIYDKNFEMGRYATAIKAAKELRNTYQLEAQIVIALNKEKAVEIEKEQKVSAIGIQNIPVHELSADAQNLLFEIAQKQLSQDTERRVTENYVHENDRPDNDKPDNHRPDNRGVSYSADQEGPKIPQPRLIRKRKPKQEEEPMTFQPLRKNAPINDSKVNLKRRMMSRMIESSDDEQYPSTPGSPLL